MSLTCNTLGGGQAVKSTNMSTKPAHNHSPHLRAHGHGGPAAVPCVMREDCEGRGDTGAAPPMAWDFSSPVVHMPSKDAIPGGQRRGDLSGGSARTMCTCASIGAVSDAVIGDSRAPVRKCYMGLKCLHDTFLNAIVALECCTCPSRRCQRGGIAKAVWPRLASGPRRPGGVLSFLLCDAWSEGPELRMCVARCRLFQEKTGWLAGLPTQ